MAAVVTEIVMGCTERGGQGSAMLTAVAPPTDPAVAWTRLAYEKTFANPCARDDDDILVQHRCLQSNTRHLWGLAPTRTQRNALHAASALPAIPNRWAAGSGTNFYELT